MEACATVSGGLHCCQGAAGPTERQVTLCVMCAVLSPAGKRPVQHNALPTQRRSLVPHRQKAARRQTQAPLQERAQSMSAWFSGWGKSNPDQYGGVEFWHSPDRCGWLTKQGAVRARFRRCCNTTLHSCSLHSVSSACTYSCRRVHQDVAEKVRVRCRTPTRVLQSRVQANQVSGPCCQLLGAQLQKELTSEQCAAILKGIDKQRKLLAVTSRADGSCSSKGRFSGSRTRLSRQRRCRAVSLT